jgi:hypothetical protein
MKRWTLTLGASASRLAAKPITVALPHGEMELHPEGNLLSRQEYFRLTQAAGLVEARAVMSHNGLEVRVAA